MTGNRRRRNGAGGPRSRNRRSQDRAARRQLDRLAGRYRSGAQRTGGPPVSSSSSAAAKTVSAAARASSEATPSSSGVNAGEPNAIDRREVGTGVDEAEVLDARVLQGQLERGIDGLAGELERREGSRLQVAEPTSSRWPSRSPERLLSAAIRATASAAAAIRAWAGAPHQLGRDQEDEDRAHVLIAPRRRVAEESRR